MSSRRRHVGTRDDPLPSHCLGVFGLSVYTSEKQLEEIFDKYGSIERVQVVLDAKVSRCKIWIGFSGGFGECENFSREMSRIFSPLKKTTCRYTVRRNWAFLFSSLSLMRT